MKTSEQFQRFPSVPLVDLDLLLADGVGDQSLPLTGQSQVGCDLDLGSLPRRISNKAEPSASACLLVPASPFFGIVSCLTEVSAVLERFDKNFSKKNHRLQ